MVEILIKIGSMVQDKNVKIPRQNFWRQRIVTFQKAKHITNFLVPDFGWKADGVFFQLHKKFASSTAQENWTPCWYSPALDYELKYLHSADVINFCFSTGWLIGF
jgi:hypothetical protein